MGNLPDIKNLVSCILCLVLHNETKTTLPHMAYGCLITRIISCLTEFALKYMYSALPSDVTFHAIINTHNKYILDELFVMKLLFKSNLYLIN